MNWEFDRQQLMKNRAYKKAKAKIEACRKSGERRNFFMKPDIRPTELNVLDEATALFGTKQSGWKSGTYEKLMKLEQALESGVQWTGEAWRASDDISITTTSAALKVYLAVLRMARRIDPLQELLLLDILQVLDSTKNRPLYRKENRLTEEESAAWEQLRKAMPTDSTDKTRVFPAIDVWPRTNRWNGDRFEMRSAGRFGLDLSEAMARERAASK